MENKNLDYLIIEFLQMKEDGRFYSYPDSRDLMIKINEIITKHNELLKEVKKLTK